MIWQDFVTAGAKLGQAEPSNRTDMGFPETPKIEATHFFRFKTVLILCYAIMLPGRKSELPVRISAGF